ncbi:hypothetical protein R0K05_23240, partial [Planococcus sp. SIMBA_160]
TLFPYTTIGFTSSSAIGLAVNNQAQLTTTGPLVVNGGRAGGSSAYGVSVRGTGRIALASGSVFNLSGLQPVGINAAGGVIAAG